MSFRFNRAIAIAGPILAVLACAASAMAGDSELLARVLGPDGRVESLGTATSLKTPLGSLYKLYLHAYLVETGQPEAPYTCSGDNPEEIFCCTPGESIDRSRALAKSCSPYFSFSRLGLNFSEWSAFWKKKIPEAPAWLVDSRQLRPETLVPVDEVLRTLSRIRSGFSSFDSIQAAVLGSVLSGTASNSLKTWGSTLRVKTYTWRGAGAGDRVDELGFTGGFAGWLPDGSSIWVSRAGHGRDAFQSELKTLVSGHLQERDPGCVRVRFFDRYPIRRMTPDDERPKGPVTVEFKNGKTLSFQGNGALKASHSSGRISLTAEMGVNEYVARVLDREVETTPIDAARAFAVAIRTYLTQNSKLVGGCREIGDSSRLQRVSPSRPSAAALEIARWTDGLLLSGVRNLRYHSSIASPNRMSWSQARDLARSGYSMPEILKTSYAGGFLAYGSPDPGPCAPHPAAARWLAHQSRRWRRVLQAEAGYEEPAELKVCQSRSGSPRPVAANLVSQEIFVPRLRTSDDETSILHEYLHIAFRNHPNGRNEGYVEKLARLLQEAR